MRIYCLTRHKVEGLFLYYSELPPWTENLLKKWSEILFKNLTRHMGRWVILQKVQFVSNQYIFCVWNGVNWIFFCGIVWYLSLYFSISKTSMNPFSLSVHGSFNTKVFHAVVCRQLHLQLFYSIISEEKLDLFGNKKKYTIIWWILRKNFTNFW